MADLFKEIIPSILVNKSDVFEDEDYSSYVPFIVNRALSSHMDCVLQANMMNMKPNLPKKIQYDYLKNSIRGYRRKFQPWLKQDKLENIELVMEYYKVSYTKAKEMLGLLKPEHINTIKAALDRGGQKDIKNART